MKNIENKTALEVKKLLTEYELKERDTHIDKNKDIWFTQRLLADLMGVSLDTISKNIREIWDWEILDEKTNKIYRNRSHSKSKIGFYSLEVLSQLGMTLRSEPARKFQKQLRELFKSLVKGEIKIVSTTKTFLDFVDTENPTPTHLKKRELWKNQGKTINQMNQRSLSIFLTNGRNWYLSELGIASQNLCSRISDIFNVFITGHTAQELRKQRNIPLKEDVREYFNPVEKSAVNEAENMFGLLVDKEKEKLTYNKAIEIAKIAAENAHIKAISTSRLLDKFYHNNTFQTDLFEIIKQ